MSDAAAIELSVDILGESTLQTQRTAADAFVISQNEGANGCRRELEPRDCGDPTGRVRYPLYNFTFFAAA